MFDVGWSELVVIGVVALIAIGPKELPTVLRTVGQWIGKVRRMAGDFQSQFNEAMREAEFADLKKQFDDISDSAKTSVGDIGALESPKPAVEAAVGQEPAAATTAAPAGASPAAEPGIAAPMATVDVPMPDPPPPPTERDFLPAEPAVAPTAPAAEPASAPAVPKPAATGSA